jgi:hypothetical protein
MDIGKPLRTITIEPVQIPVPQREERPATPRRQPAPRKQPAKEPAKTPEKVPA